MRKNVEHTGRRIRLERFILHSLAVGGVVAVSVVAPNVVGALKKIDPRWVDKLNPCQRVSQALYRLKRKGLVVGTARGVQLTQKGEALLKKIDGTQFRVKKPLRWDGRWRMVIFDIPEHRRTARNMFRHLLQKVGFVRVQNSVWVYPYDCEEVIQLLKTHQHLGRHVLYAIVDVLENDMFLRKYFKLRP